MPLASSDGSLQAFRLNGTPQWGIQFHAEVTPADLRDWIKNFHTDPDAAGLDPEALLAESEPRLEEWNELGRGAVRALPGRGRMSTADVVREMFAAFEADGVDGALAHFAPDAVLVVGPRELREPDTYEGVPGGRRYFEGFEGALDEVRFELVGGHGGAPRGDHRRREAERRGRRDADPGGAGRCG